RDGAAAPDAHGDRSAADGCAGDRNGGDRNGGDRGARRDRAAGDRAAAGDREEKGTQPTAGSKAAAAFDPQRKDLRSMMISSAIAVLALFALTTAAPTPSKLRKAEQLAAKGVASYKANAFDRAAEYFLR